jgi:hypothetical protein
LLREVRERGYTGGITQLNDFLRSVRPPPVAPFEVRFETAAGRQAQVDFAHFAVEFDDEPGVVHRVWLFAMVLGASRYLWAQFVMHQDLGTVLHCHMQAFEHFGGTPREILYDRGAQALALGTNGGEQRTRSQRGTPRAGHLRGRGPAAGRGGARGDTGRSGTMSAPTSLLNTVPGNTTERIRRHLVGLKMPRALEALQMTLARIEQGEVTALEAIENLLGEEYTTRESRRIKMALQTARLPTIKTLSG